MLTATDPLPHRPSRVTVAGVSGSGKSTLSRRIAEILGVPYTEIDSLYHGAGWTRRPEFKADVEAFTSAPAWVTEWQYDSARPLLAERADLLVWLDPPYPMVLQRVVRRTLRRRLCRQTLWNGNREPPLWTFFTDDEHIVRWSIRTRHLYDERIPAVAVQRPDLTIVRLRSTRDVNPWLRDVLGR